MALANSGLGAVHGFAAPIGGMFDAPHGAVCAAVLPHAFAVNKRAVAAIVDRGGEEGRAYQARLQRIVEVERTVGGRTSMRSCTGAAARETELHNSDSLGMKQKNTARRS